MLCIHQFGSLKAWIATNKFLGIYGNYSHFYIFFIFHDPL